MGVIKKPEPEKAPSQENEEHDDPHPMMLPFVERMSAWAKLSEKNRRIAEMKKAQAEAEVLTFKPKIHSKSKHRETDIYEYDRMRMEIRDRRLEAMRRQKQAEEEQEITFQPNITPNSERLAAKRDTRSFVASQREWSHRVQRKLQEKREQKDKAEEEELTFTPKINKHSERILKKAAHASPTRHTTTTPPGPKPGPYQPYTPVKRSPVSRIPQPKPPSFTTAGSGRVSIESSAWAGPSSGQPGASVSGIYNNGSSGVSAVTEYGVTSKPVTPFDSLYQQAELERERRRTRRAAHTRPDPAPAPAAPRKITSAALELWGPGPHPPPRPLPVSPKPLNATLLTPVGAGQSGSGEGFREFGGSTGKNDDDDIDSQLESLAATLVELDAEQAKLER
ncbi:hypothetical protein J8273_6267 [Carpediemonas membranifera]|uniref:Uncharacterized protein n=1 Tax=Carpediemonas membranifera TaxID=201153 RepID=A0A8J6ASU0_9EUKA|nr:hypothetical protein J8273_6267 [Carpediemonas membranifera]|eukprot:KAG9391505.1 hypothetical protein J8273_6267 [Carpediemonas membranifera]